MKTIADHILDIVQNSAEAKATLIEIIVIEDKIKDFYNLEIKDNGCGMNEEILQKVINPFFTTRKTRRVGLGIPLLKQNVAAANGSFEILSEKGIGTLVKARFQLSHIDRPPVGDVWNSLYLLFVGCPEINIVYSHTTGRGTFMIGSAELRKMLDGISLQQASIKKAVVDLVKNNLEVIMASK